MVDVKVELQEVVEDAASGPRAASPPPRRNKVLLILAGLVGALAVAASLLLVRSHRPANPSSSVIPLTSTSGFEWNPTFSPDGQQVAFQWDGERQDNTDVYVKMVGSSETRRLTTESARDVCPSWSPDGRLIAFVRAPGTSTTGAIHLISPLGGSDRRLSDEPVAVGYAPSWSPDGRWLATGATSAALEAQSRVPNGIRLIDSSTGEARSITTPGGTAFHAAPTFSPNGRHLAYTSCPRSFSCQLVVVELGADYIVTGAEQRLTRRVIWLSGLAWTRDGKSVVYGDSINTRLWRAGIAGDTPPEPVEIAGFGASAPAIAGSSDRLAFSRSLSNPDIYRFMAGRPPEVVAASSFTDWNPHLAPDGSRVAFESSRGGQGAEIWTAATDGKDARPLTHGPGLWQGSPRWSPDGRSIAFDSLDEAGQWDIWAIDADGGSLRRLTSDPADDNHPTWSRDRRFVYFNSNRTGAQTLWRASATGRSEVQVTQAVAGRVEESADGTLLYFQRIVLGASPLLAVSVAGGPERTVIDCVPRYGFAIGAAGIYHLACGGSRAVPLRLLDLATGQDRLLGTLEGPLGAGLTVSADGKTILFTKVVGEGRDLVLIENFR